MKRLLPDPIKDPAGSKAFCAMMAFMFLWSALTFCFIMLSTGGKRSGQVQPGGNLDHRSDGTGNRMPSLRVVVVNTLLSLWVGGGLVGLMLFLLWYFARRPTACTDDEVASEMKEDRTGRA